MTLQVCRQKQDVFVVVREGTDYTDAIDELQLQLTHVVVAINELLEELKYSKAELVEIAEETKAVAEALADAEEASPEARSA